MQRTALAGHTTNVPSFFAKTPTMPPACDAADRTPSASRAEAREFERLYDEYVEFVWRGARRLGVAEEALDDVVQHVFLVVHRRLGAFEGRSSIKTWLFSILLHVVREHHRSVRRKSPHWFMAPSDPDTLEDRRAGTNPDDALARAEASRTIDRLLESLDEEKRIVFVMAELEQMTANEISEATGLEPKAVYSRLRAARIDFERAAERMRRAMAGAANARGTTEGARTGTQK